MRLCRRPPVVPFCASLARPGVRPGPSPGEARFADEEVVLLRPGRQTGKVLQVGTGAGCAKLLSIRDSFGRILFESARLQGEIAGEGTEITLQRNSALETKPGKQNAACVCVCVF